MQFSFTFDWLREWLEPRIFYPVTNDNLSRARSLLPLVVQNHREGSNHETPLITS